MYAGLGELDFGDGENQLASEGSDYRAKIGDAYNQLLSSFGIQLLGVLSSNKKCVPPPKIFGNLVSDKNLKYSKAAL